MYNEQNAKVTLQQLTGANNPAPRLLAMIGASNINFSGKDRCVNIRFKAKAKKAVNFCKITLNSLDLYDVELGTIRAGKYKAKHTVNNIYGDMLKSTFEQETGLYLSL